MFCPQCKTEYRDGFSRCSDCDIGLIAELPKSTEPAAYEGQLLRLVPTINEATECYLHAFRKYAVFKGRARRREYWLFELMNSFITLVLFVCAVLLGKAGYPYVLGLPLLYVVATTIPSVSSLVRRLHDTNHSAWWLLISMVPGVGALFLIGTTVTDSDSGTNRFGPNPKQPHTPGPTGGPEMGYLAPPIDPR